MKSIEFWKDYPEQEKVYYASPPSPSTFENSYLGVRSKEGRLYSDDIVLTLPLVPRTHPQHDEWKTRNFTCTRLLHYLSTKRPGKILDLGCGNGWFTNQICQNTHAAVIGLDINRFELKQAAKLYTSNKCKFIFGHVFTDQFPLNHFDFIILNASIQYFLSIPELISRLSELLTVGGEIHILNSPIYKNKTKAEEAKNRSLRYFHSIGSPDQIGYYHHHYWDEFSKYSYHLLYNPNALPFVIWRKILNIGNPFPWIRILETGASKPR